jgi:sortase A
VKNSLVETTGELPKESVYDPEVLLRWTENSPQVRFDIIPYENRIVIPKIGKNIPLVDVAVDQEFDFDHMENIFMKELEKWVVRYPGTARPGELGNAFIFGHSSNYPWIKWEYNDVFALLDNLDYGDEIIVYYNQKKFVYTVNEKQVVRPGNVKVLERDESKKELSLMTCWPVGTTLNRMIVFAELTETSNQ